MEQLAEGFKALADPTRLRLLGLLAHGERCVCDLVEALGMPQSKVSRHLGYLKKERWVSGRRCGKWMYYKLAQPRQPILVKLMELLQEHLGDDATAMQDAVRLRQRLETKPLNCCDELSPGGAPWKKIS
jgi:ArsR family transcriptional regulator